MLQLHANIGLTQAAGCTPALRAAHVHSPDPQAVGHSPTPPAQLPSPSTPCIARVPQTSGCLSQGNACCLTMARGYYRSCAELIHHLNYISDHDGATRVGSRGGRRWKPCRSLPSPLIFQQQAAGMGGCGESIGCPRATQVGCSTPSTERLRDGAPNPAADRGKRAAVRCSELRCLHFTCHRPAALGKVPTHPSNFKAQFNNPADVS